MIHDDELSVGEGTIFNDRFGGGVRQMNRAKEEADKLRSEAVRLLNLLLKIPKGCSCDATERLVDCLVGAAMLETTAVQYDALNQRSLT